MIPIDHIVSRVAMLSRAMRRNKNIEKSHNAKSSKKRLLRNNAVLLNVYQIYAWIVFVPFLALSTAGLGIVATVLAIAFGGKVASVMGVIWSRMNSYLTPMVVKVIGKEKIDKKQSYVIIANHQSHYDIFVIYGWLPIDFRWVMKIQLLKVPFLGYSCYKIGHIFIDRSNPQKAKESINAAKDRIKGGTSIMFFPEGTRSDDGSLREFKKGAFKFALDMNLPILPITIIGTRNILPARSMKLFPGKAMLVIHDPIEIAGYTEDRMDDLIAVARQRIEEGLLKYSSTH
ncbi:MAG: 1-acyl-sn-glycerol-3-phosphate acyltransferase [Spirochaetes bacterium]|nr:1-acyl-sn-glycerol-3-phosphate acyltransferase [Spirochaetota bacterium]